MIDITEDFAARIGAEVTALAFCWQVIRTDGVAIGFTSHDRDIELDGLTYRSQPGIAPSAIQMSNGIETEDMEIAGALSARAITDADLAIGRYDGANVRLFMVDWSAPQAGQMPLMRGRRGAINQKDDAFTAELRGPASMLDAQAVELLSPECRAYLGDQRCRVDLVQHQRRVRVIEVTDEAQIRVDALEPVDNAYAYGRIRFLEGANAGFDLPIVKSAGDIVIPAQLPSYALESGTLVELREGCDRRFSTCRARFANAANFQGEPHVPGNDLLTRYPGI